MGGRTVLYLHHGLVKPAKLFGTFFLLWRAKRLGVLINRSRSLEQEQKVAPKGQGGSQPEPQGTEPEPGGTDMGAGVVKSE